MKKFTLVFLYAFILNLLWEFAHQFLYVHYKASEITAFILTRAALNDALIILGLVLVLYSIPFLRKYPWLLILAGVTFSVVMEYWALGTGRWEYNDGMPMIPFLNTGLSPTIQLGLIAYVVYKLVFRDKKQIYTNSLS